MNRTPILPVAFPEIALFDPNNTVTRSLSLNPRLTPGQAVKKLFPKILGVRRLLRRFRIKRDLIAGREFTPEELDEAERRGQFGSRPSDLFLKMYSDVLICLARDPLAGNCSPALLGTQGVVVLSIVSSIPTIMAHYADVILFAKHEIMLQTNYWQPSDSVNTISNALKELSKRVGERGGEKIIVKIVWDRGSPKQFYQNHVAVEPITWAEQDLPLPAEVPNLSLQVINFHRPILGTFHQKLLIVDRKVALLNSNNIQDRPNLEFCIHLEGPVVDSLYDTMLISWHNALEPTLPCIDSASKWPIVDGGSSGYQFQMDNEALAGVDMVKGARAARKFIQNQERAQEEVSVHGNGVMVLPNGVAVVEEGEKKPEGAFATLVNGITKPIEKLAESSTRHLTKLETLSESLNAGAKAKADAASPLTESILDDFKPHLLHQPHRPFPIALVNRKPHGLFGHQDVRVPQDAAWLAGLRYAQKKVFIQTPTLNARPLKHGIVEACSRGVEVELWLSVGFNDQSEGLLFQGGTNQDVTTALYRKLNAIGKGDFLRVHWYVAKDQVAPIDAAHKTRNCHIKFFSVDGQVAIVGNGNQDTQSWFHSQECNILIDSSEIVESWLDQLRTNQSTAHYGRVDGDGIWRDKRTGKGVLAPKKMGCLSAIVGLL